jgi:aspartate aminotransferase
MFESLSRLPADPILNLMTLYREDPRPEKVDLGVGVFKDEAGLTPVLRAVREAEALVLSHQVTKTYVAPEGNAAFIESLLTLALQSVASRCRDRLAAIQTPGGCGALRLAAELIQRDKPGARIWVSDPTWGNHIPLLGAAGLAIHTYPYLDAEQTGLDWPAMQRAILQVQAGDLVLLHASCHNPTGIDLTLDQWEWLAERALEQGFIPFIDMAYQGFGEGLDADTAGLRHLFAQLPQALLVVSCSKNFGLYRERVGLLAVLCDTPQRAGIVKSHLLALVRSIYSMPPDHGAAIVATLLSSTPLRALWESEVTAMRERIQSLRHAFAREMAARACPGFEFVARQRGMFSYLGLSAAQVDWLARTSAIYLLSSSRASIAGLSAANLGYVCDAMAAVERLDL